MSGVGFFDKKQHLAAAFIASFIVIGLSLLLFAPAAEATSTANMPAQTDFTNAGGPVHPVQPGVRLVVSAISPGNSLKAPTSQVRVYSKTKNVQLQFEEWRHCSGNHDTDYVSTTTFEVFRTNKNEDQAPFGAAVFNNGGQCAGNSTKTINVKAAQPSGREGHEGWYVLIVKASIGNGGVNSFKIKSPGNRIGYSQEAGERFAIQDRTRESNTKMNATFEFAPPCDMNSNQTVSVRWADDDYNASPQSPFIGQLDAQLQKRAPGGSWQNIDASMKNLFVGGGKSQEKTFTAQPNYKYRWTWKNVAKNNGIQFKLPFDSFWYDTTCPPDNAWRNTLSTALNLRRVSFTQVALPTDTKPSGYDIGMNCGAYYNQNTDAAKDRKKRCDIWNGYYQANRNRAVDALHKANFKHFVTNRAPVINNVKHGKTPYNTGGCSNSVALSSYCARIQYRVYNASGSAGNQWSDWRWRFSSSSTTSSAPNNSEDVKHNGYSSELNKRQTRQVWKSDWNTSNRPQGMPPATKDITDKSNTANQLHALLKNPEQGDQYCERVVSKNPSSYNNHRIESNAKCVILSTADEDDPYWNLKPTVSVDNVVQQGANVTPRADVFLPITDNGYDDDDEIDAPGRNGDGPEGDDYTKTAIDNSGVSGWRLSKFTLPPNNTIEDLDDVQLQQIATNGLNGCDWVKSQAPSVNDCGQKASSSLNNVTFQPGSAPTQLPTSGSFSADGTASAPVGSQICYLASVYRPLMGHPGDVNASGNVNPDRAWRHSSVACVSVVKSPKVQFLNGDVRAGRGFEGHDMSGGNSDQAGACLPANSGQKAMIITSGSANSTDNRYGSWVEYGAFATDKIVGFGSAATSVGMSNYNRLTFANTSGVAVGFSAGGDFKFNSCLPNYFDWVDQAKATNKNSQASNLDVKALNDNPGGQYIISGADATLSDTAFGMTNSAILRVKKDGSGSGGKVTINGNIRFFDSPSLPYASFNDLPQLIIIADGDIIIDENVEQIDAWLISKGKIMTCGSNVAPNGGQCTKQLRINGPVAATKLELYRTYGADLSSTSAARPAELFTLNPVHLLKRYGPTGGGSSNPNPSVLSEIELPPRY